MGSNPTGPTTFMPFVSRAGEKLEYALNTFGVDIAGKICADFGASTGGFVDCLLQHGATRVYAIERGYGALEWLLRNDPRVVVKERTNAMHVELPERVDFITIDTSWTKLATIVPNALKNLKPDGEIIALVKPHYEAEARELRQGKLPEEKAPEVLAQVIRELEGIGLQLLGETTSPIVGKKGANVEYLIHLNTRV